MFKLKLYYKYVPMVCFTIRSRIATLSTSQIDEVYAINHFACKVSVMDKNYYKFISHVLFGFYVIFTVSEIDFRSGSSYSQNLIIMSHTISLFKKPINGSLTTQISLYSIIEKRLFQG